MFRLLAIGKADGLIAQASTFADVLANAYATIYPKAYRRKANRTGQGVIDVNTF